MRLAIEPRQSPKPRNPNTLHLLILEFSPCLTYRSAVTAPESSPQRVRRSVPTACGQKTDTDKMWGRQCCLPSATSHNWANKVNFANKQLVWLLQPRRQAW